jgi:UDP-glucose 4-epimerase
MRKVLIVGIAGGQGRLLARRLLDKHEVVGTDRDEWTSKPPGLVFYQVDLRKRGFEDVIRKEQPDTVVHMGFVRHFEDAPGLRYDVNVRGTRKLLDHCRTFGVQQVVIVSSSYVYGALAENPYFMDEDYPLSGSRNYPEIRDLVEVDTLSTAFMWRHPNVRTAVVRPVPVLGRYVRSAIATYLRTQRVIVMMGFNPMMQFIHEEDLTEAIALTVEGRLRGAYNVVGPGEIPLRVAIRETGGSAFPLPEFVARPLIERAFRLGLYPFPPGAIDYIKYPCTISGRRFADETGFRPLFGLKETLRSVRR